MLDNQHILVKTNAGKEIAVNIAEPMLGKISALQVYELAEEYEDQEDVVQININNIVEIENDKSSSEVEKITNTMSIAPEVSDIQSQWEWSDLYVEWDNTYYYDTSCGNRTEYIAADFFVISVAKGQTQKLTKTWTQSMTTSASVNVGAAYGGVSGSVTGGISNTITCSYSAEIVWSSDGMKSGFNSREFRVRFFENRGTWHQEATGWPSGHTSYARGTFKKPIKYLEYSIDHTVS